MNGYTPRRQSARWLDGDCPRGVLALYDNGGKTFDRFTVFYADPVPGPGGPRIGGLGMSTDPFHPQGLGCSFEYEAHEVAAYRYRASHDAVKWSDLPPRVKECIRADLAG